MPVSPYEGVALPKPACLQLWAEEPVLSLWLVAQQAGVCSRWDGASKDTHIPSCSAAAGGMLELGGLVLVHRHF